MSQDIISLDLQVRETVGKRLRALRRSGQVPAVIHDHGKASIAVQGDYVAMTKAYKAAGKHHPIELTAGTHKYTAMIKFAEFEPRKNMLSHVVFNAVNKNQKVEAEIPVHPRYDEGNEASPAERNGLMVISNTESVMVEATADKLPDALEYDAEKLVEVGDHVTVADLIVPAGVEIKVEPEHTIATVYEPSAVAAANDAAGGDADADDAATVDSDEGTPEEDEPAKQETDKEPGGDQ